MWRFLNGATDWEIDFLKGELAGFSFIRAGFRGNQEDEQIKEEMKIMRGNRKGRGRKRACLVLSRVANLLP